MLSKITPAIVLLSANKHQQSKERYSSWRYCAIPAYKRTVVRAGLGQKLALAFLA